MCISICVKWNRTASTFFCCDITKFFSHSLSEIAIHFAPLKYSLMSVSTLPQHQTFIVPIKWIEPQQIVQPMPLMLAQLTHSISESNYSPHPTFDPPSSFTVTPSISLPVLPSQQSSLLFFPVTSSCNSLFRPIVRALICFTS